MSMPKAQQTNGVVLKPFIELKRNQRCLKEKECYNCTTFEICVEKLRDETDE